MKVDIEIVDQKTEHDASMGAKMLVIRMKAMGFDLNPDLFEGVEKVIIQFDDLEFIPEYHRITKPIQIR